MYRYLNLAHIHTQAPYLSLSHYIPLLLSLSFSFIFSLNLAICLALVLFIWESIYTRSSFFQKNLKYDTQSWHWTHGCPQYVYLILHRTNISILYLSAIPSHKHINHIPFWYTRQYVYLILHPLPSHICTHTHTHCLALCLALALISALALITRIDVHNINTWHINTWHINTWHIKTWHIKTWHIKTWHIKTWHIKTWHIKTWHPSALAMYSHTLFLLHTHTHSLSLSLSLS